MWLDLSGGLFVRNLRALDGRGRCDGWFGGRSLVGLGLLDSRRRRRARLVGLVYVLGPVDDGDGAVGAPRLLSDLILRVVGFGSRGAIFGTDGDH